MPASPQCQRYEAATRFPCLILHYCRKHVVHQNNNLGCWHVSLCKTPTHTHTDTQRLRLSCQTHPAWEVWAGRRAERWLGGSELNRRPCSISSENHFLLLQKEPSVVRDPLRAPGSARTNTRVKTQIFPEEHDDAVAHTITAAVPGRCWCFMEQIDQWLSLQGFTDHWWGYDTQIQLLVRPHHLGVNWGSSPQHIITHKSL